MALGLVLSACADESATAKKSGVQAKGYLDKPGNAPHTHIRDSDLVLFKSKDDKIGFDKADISKLKQTDERHFMKDVIFNPKPSVVMCVDRWSEPCKLLSPIMDQVAALPKYSRDIQFYYVRADKCTDLSQSYNLHVMPTVLFFKGGNVKFQSIGFTKKENIEKLIDKLH